MPLAADTSLSRVLTGILISLHTYGNFAFLANIGHSSVGWRHNPPTNGGKFNAHERAIDPALGRGGLGFNVQLLVVQWRLYLFVSLGNMAATTQP